MQLVIPNIQEHRGDRLCPRPPNLPAPNRFAAPNQISYPLGLAMPVLLWTALAGWTWAGDSPTAHKSWWLARNLRIVTYEFLERGHRQSDLSVDEILAYLDRLGGCDLVLLKGFHYWQGKFDDSSWGYPRFRGLAETLIPKLHARGIKAGNFGFTDRRRSYQDGPDHRRIMDVWKEYVRLGPDILFVDEESGRGGLDIPVSCLSHCDELRTTFKLPVGLFMYGAASQAGQVREFARHVDVIGEMGYNLFLEARGEYGLEDVTRKWSDAVKALTNCPVAYWTGTLVVEKGSQAPGTPFWRQRFGDRTLAGYFEGYIERALTSGADGVFFHSICRLSGLPPKTQEEITAVMKRRFKEMGVRPGRGAAPGDSHSSDASSAASSSASTCRTTASSRKSASGAPSRRSRRSDVESRRGKRRWAGAPGCVTIGGMERKHVPANVKGLSASAGGGQCGWSGRHPKNGMAWPAMVYRMME